MAGSITVDALEEEFFVHPERNQILSAQAQAEANRQRFLAMYPAATVSTCFRFRQQAETFVKWLGDELRPLGGVNLWLTRGEARSSTGDHKDDLATMVARMLAPGLSRDRMVDLPWGTIPWWGGEDRQLAKKAICTYLPDGNLPIFKTEHLEHFVALLGLQLERDKEASRFGVPYGDRLTIGQKWDVLTNVLLSVKSACPKLHGHDNVYFMYCLYNSSARPDDI